MLTRFTRPSKKPPLARYIPRIDYLWVIADGTVDTLCLVSSSFEKSTQNKRRPFGPHVSEPHSLSLTLSSLTLPSFTLQASLFGSCSFEPLYFFWLFRLFALLRSGLTASDPRLRNTRPVPVISVENEVIPQLKHSERASGGV